MSILPEVDYVKEKILEENSQEELDKVVELLKKNPVFKKNEKLLYKIAASRLGVDIKVELSGGSMFSDEDVQPISDTYKISDLSKATLKIGNLNAWLIKVGKQLRNRGEGKTDLQYITIADETGLLDVPMFGNSLDEFANEGFNVGTPIAFRGLLLQTDDGHWTRIGSKTTWERYKKDKHGDLCSVRELSGKDIQDLQDEEYPIVSGFVISHLDVINTYSGCPECGGSMSEFEVGQRTNCDKCNNVVNVIEKKRRAFVISNGDEANVTINVWSDPSEVPPFGIGDTVLIAGGKYDAERNSMSLQSIIVTDTLDGALNGDLKKKSSSLVIDTIVGDIKVMKEVFTYIANSGSTLKEIVKNSSLTEEEASAAIEKLKTESLAYDDRGKIKLFDNSWKLICDEFGYSYDGFELSTEISINDLDFGNNLDDLVYPNEEQIIGAEAHFKQVISFFGSMTPADLQSVLAEREGECFNMQPIIKHLLDNDIIKLIKAGRKVKFEANK